MLVALVAAGCGQSPSTAEDFVHSHPKALAFKPGRPEASGGGAPVLTVTNLMVMDYYYYRGGEVGTTTRDFGTNPCYTVEGTFDLTKHGSLAGGRIHFFCTGGWTRRPGCKDVVDLPREALTGGFQLRLCLDNNEILRYGQALGLQLGPANDTARIEDSVTLTVSDAASGTHAANGGRAGLDIHSAAAAGDLETAKGLLTAKADLASARDKYHRTPLHWAAGLGRKEVVALLLEGGANLDPTDIEGLTPLIAAAAGGHNDVVESLLVKGANVNARAKDGESSLHRATFNGHKDTVALLLKYKADPNAKDNNGRPPQERPW